MALPYGSRADAIDALGRIDRLGEVFILHTDGHIREAALRVLTPPVRSPALVFALFSRLNDWAEQNRHAARDAAARCLPDTPAQTIAPALKQVLQVKASWQRWSQAETDLVDGLLCRPDVAATLMEDVITSRAAALGPLLRALLRNPANDNALPHAMRDATLPHIRAMALYALLNGKTRFPTGEFRKIPHTARYRLDPVYAEREITIEVDILDCLRAGAQDPASIVRKSAADGLIRHRKNPQVTGGLSALYRRLKDDKNVAVRGRMDFLHRKCLEEGRHL